MMSMLAAFSASSVRYQSATRLISSRLSPLATAMRCGPILQPIAINAARALRRRAAGDRRNRLQDEGVAEKVRLIIDVDQQVHKVGSLQPRLDESLRF